MSYCKKCGTENSSSNMFCKKCGESIGTSTSSESGLREEVRRLEEEIRQLKKEKTLKEQEEKDREKKEKKKNKKEKVIIEENLEKIKEEIKDEVADEIKEEIKESVTSEVSHEIKNEVSKKVKNDLKKEISTEIKEDALTDIKDEVSGEIKKEVRAEIKSELSETMELIGLSEAIKSKKKRGSSPFLLFLMILVVAGGYLYFSYMFGPRHIAKEYLEALKDNDYAALYDYENFDSNIMFVSESRYLELLKENMDSHGRLIDYDIEDVIYSEDGKTATVKTVSTYIKDNTEYKNNLDIVLYRDTEKKYVIFYTWHIKDNSSLGIEIIDDYKIFVPAGSKVVFDGVELGNEYLQVYDDATVDVYNLPQVLSKNTELKVILANGVEFVKEVTPSQYYKEYRVKVDSDDIEDYENIISDSIVNSLEKIVNAGFSKKSFDSLKEIVSEVFEIDDLKKKFNSYLDKMDSQEASLSNFNISNISVLDVDFNHSYQYVVNIKINYTWKSSLVGITSDKEDFGFYTVYLNYENGEYKLVDINQLPDVFIN